MHRSRVVEPDAGRPRRGARRAARASGAAGDGARRVEAGAPRRQAREFVRRRLEGRGLRHDAPDDGAAVVRRRAPLQRRLLAARRLHGRGDLQVGGGRHEAAVRSDVLAARRLRHGRREARPRLEDPAQAGRPRRRDVRGLGQVRAGQAPRVPQVLRHVVARTPGHADGRHGARQVLPRRQIDRPQQAGPRVPLRDARGGARAPPGRRRHRRLPVPQPRAPRALRALHAGPRRAERRRRRRGARPPDLRPDAAGRHPRHGPLQDLRGAQGGDGEPADLLGVPALLDAHGGAPRGHPPHDDPQELRLHALYYWARHGGLQVQHRRGGLLRRL
mmetsp:Transcript_25854/g.67048  ORF Transcript_25854/g.67048 Transcript_25854/m.67048 type:complete len:331 (+) Transcript_25854:136-1128(+)